MSNNETWETKLEKHATLHTGNCYCDTDERCEYSVRLKAFIREQLTLARRERDAEILSKLVSERIHYGCGGCDCTEEWLQEYLYPTSITHKDL